MFIRLILLKFSRIFSSADISLQNTKGGRFPGAYLFSYHGFIQIYKHFYNLPNIKHLCDLSSIKQTSPVQDSVIVTTRSPAGVLSRGGYPPGQWLSGVLWRWPPSGKAAWRWVYTPLPRWPGSAVWMGWRSRTPGPVT